MSGAMQVGYLAPPTDVDSRFWWEALADHRLLVPRCDECSKSFFPPQPTCPHCGAGSWTAVESSGEGAIYTWIVVNMSLEPAFATDVPYTIVVVELDEGARLFGRLVPGAEPSAGLRARPHYYEVEGTTFLGFEPAA
jgi:uncharacterized OB-fold protein